MKVKFIYRDHSYNSQREQVISRICLYTSIYIELPEQIEVELQDLGPAAYGETIVNNQFKNRIKINSALSLKELIFPVVHELMHIHQMHTGQLMASRDGSCIWEGKAYKISNPLSMSYKEYKMLPWEVDADQKQKKVLPLILDKDM